MDEQTMLETLLLHADADSNELAVAPPIYQTAPFSAASAEEFHAMSTTPRHDRFYQRYGNPTQNRLQEVVATIEGAEAALATSSGMGAISTMFLALLSRGDQVIAQQSMYGGTLSLLHDLAPRLGISVTEVDQTEPLAFARAITPNTKLIMLETPSNPLLHLTDLDAISELARERGILTSVDNTIATPINQRPLDHGVDLVLHSVTKALSGHSDVLAGMVLGRAELIDQIWQTHLVLGSVISPFDAWLALRGLRTLSMRVEWQNRAAHAVAEFLASHSAVRTVNYPGLASHPQHELAKRQMRGHGGLLSFELADGDAAEKFIAALRLPVRSASLGGYRSLVVRPAAMWAAELTDDQLVAAGVPAGLVRLAVGLENKTDLISDLEQALESLSTGKQ